MKKDNPHGGKREGAGRKPDEIPTVVYYRRVTKENAEKLDIFLSELKKTPRY